MKRFLSILLAALLCFGVAALPAAAEDAAEPEPTTQLQEEPAQPAPDDPTEPTQPAPETPAEPEQPALSPYEAPTDLDFDDYWAWESSLYGRYYYWRSGLGEDRPQFDPAFRQFYRDDPELFIENHLVFKKVKSYAWEGKKRVRRTYAVILDYFDTQDACTTLHIPATLDGCPVSFYMQRDSAWSGGLSDSGYTNNTVKKLILEEGITGVGPFAFSNFTRLIAVRIPSTVTSIGVSAFRGCTALRKVFGCAGLERLQSGAFQGCEKLRFFENMDKLKGIEGGAFANTGFKTLTLSGGVTLGGGDEDYYE
ncbi:MAG: leucine-rich repeat protein, partial [Clostridia bacterium]|nr:leucine-rich repeat protein [Clostridia bacterium]